MPIRARSSVLKVREALQSTPTFKSLERKPRLPREQISRNPYQTVSVKAFGIQPKPTSRRQITHKLTDVHKRNALFKQISFNSSNKDQSDSGYDTVASASTAAESYMPRGRQNYVTSARTSPATSRVPSGKGDRRRMELNSTQTSFPSISKPDIQVVDLSNDAFEEARPTIRKVQDEIEILSKSIESMNDDTEYFQQRALPQQNQLFQMRRERRERSQRRLPALSEERYRHH